MVVLRTGAVLLERTFVVVDAFRFGTFLLSGVLNAGSGWGEPD
jgi:hypothetical protein